MTRQQPDLRLIWMAIAAARLTLFERGEIDIEEACDGLFDDWPFQLACERADAAAKKRPVDHKTERLRRLLASDWSIDGVHRVINSNMGGARAAPLAKRTVTA
jgi:hypothetical protein